MDDVDEMDSPLRPECPICPFLVVVVGGRLCQPPFQTPARVALFRIPSFYTGGTFLPKIRERTNSTRNTKNNSLAMPAAVPAMPPNPRTAAISAIIKKVMAQEIIGLIRFLSIIDSRGSGSRIGRTIKENIRVAGGGFVRGAPASRGWYRLLAGTNFVFCPIIEWWRPTRTTFPLIKEKVRVDETPAPVRETQIVFGIE